MREPLRTYDADIDESDPRPTRAKQIITQTAVSVGLLEGLKRELRGAGKNRSRDPLLLEIHMYHGMGTDCTSYLDWTTR